MQKLEDYVFLSDRNSRHCFIIERDGDIWQQMEYPKPYFIPGRRGTPLLNWKKICPGKQIRWRWRQNFLPVLEISDELDNILELLADSDRLLARINGKRIMELPDQSNSLSQNQFSRKISQITGYWTEFFSACPDIIVPQDQNPDAWKACIVQAMQIYYGRHPRYGTGYYGCSIHDAFPPATIAMTDCLMHCNHTALAMDLMGFYLQNYIMPDGTIDYYGPSLAEYGMILNAAAKMLTCENGRDWYAENGRILKSMVRFLMRKRNPIRSGQSEEIRLLHGGPEADTREMEATYVHNNAWCWRGLMAWSRSMAAIGEMEAAAECSLEADDLKKCLEQQIRNHELPDGLPPFCLEDCAAIQDFAQSRNAAYANQRYYPELLESGFLSPSQAQKIIEARELRGGELEGMTLFHAHAAWPDLDLPPFCCNNWPIFSYARGLTAYSTRERLERVIRNHYLHHQSQDTFTAYESVEAESPKPVRQAYTDWCVPVQLAYPRMIMLLQK